MKKLLSIIVPIYKVEAYVNKCLNSLLLYVEDENGDRVLDTARMDLMDILIINDGTPDMSAEMSREYVKKYPKYFRQIDKENGGHGSVWNLGVQDARGVYIRFLDSDDWLENLDVLIDKLRTTDADLVLTHTLDHCENNELWQETVRGFEFEHVYDIDSYDWAHYIGRLNSFLHHSCTFKRDVLLPHLPLFLEKQPYDDSILPMALICKAHTLVAFDVEVYHYLMDRPGQSISREQIVKNQEFQMRANKQTILFLEQHIEDNKTLKMEFLKRKLKKLYQVGYKPMKMLPYEANRKRSKQWDGWVITQKNHPITLFMLLYRCLPYRLYYQLCKIVLKR